METPNRLQENISAMVDNELPASEVELTLAALSEPEGLAAWRLYHAIGDALRAHQPEAELSGDFAARLAGRLAAEELPGRPGEPGAREGSATATAATLP
jgi:sigma-E factor negative regulatory protein RseA